jgi:hypothetical protein
MALVAVGIRKPESAIESLFYSDYKTYSSRMNGGIKRFRKWCQIRIG